MNFKSLLDVGRSDGLSPGDTSMRALSIALMIFVCAVPLAEARSDQRPRRSRKVAVGQR